MTGNPIDSTDPVDLQVHLYNIDGLAVLQLSGECDLASRETLHMAITEALEADRPTIIDVSRLTYCDASCAGPLIEASRHAQLALAIAPTRVVTLVFDLLDPTEELPRYRSLEAAVQDLSHGDHSRP